MRGCLPAILTITLSLEVMTREALSLAEDLLEESKAVFDSFEPKWSVLAKSYSTRTRESKGEDIKSSTNSSTEYPHGSLLAAYRCQVRLVEHLYHYQQISDSNGIKGGRRSEAH